MNGRLKHSERRIVERALEMESGYVLDFSNRTMSEFFEDEFNIAIYDDAWAHEGTSKANRLRCFINTANPKLIPHVLRRLWQMRLEQRRVLENADDEAALRDRYFEIVGLLEGDAARLPTDSIESFEPSETLEELVKAIGRDIDADRPATALDRLHTYCMKRFAHLIHMRGGAAVAKEEALHARVGRYRKLLESERTLSEMSARIIRSSISIFEAFNTVRNSRSLAHDNELIDAKEARFIFASIVVVLRFIKAIEADRFEAAA